MHAALIGFGLGFFVALQLGPMSLFLIRSTLRSGWKVGLGIGAGIACIDGLYAAAGAGGATPLLSIQPVRLALGLIGAAVLIFLGARTLYSAVRVRVGSETPFETSTARRAFLTALGGTASNPTTIVSWGAIFGAASTAGTREHHECHRAPGRRRGGRQPDVGDGPHHRRCDGAAIDGHTRDPCHRQCRGRRAPWIRRRARLHHRPRPLS